MNEITRRITVDLLRRGNTRLVFARQNDVLSRKVRISLTAAGEPYKVPKGTQALLNVLRADGESAAFSADITEDGDVEVILSLWMLSVVGETRCSVSLIDEDGKKLTGDDFVLDVMETLYEGTEITEDENYSLLTDLISDIAEIDGQEIERAEAEKIRVEKEAERCQAETLRQDAEALRADAELIRDKAEKDRIAAEEAREKAVQDAIKDIHYAEHGSAEDIEVKDINEYYEADNIEGVLNEVGTRLGKLDTSIDALYGRGGTLVLNKDSFDDMITLTIEMSDLSSYDMISFSASTLEDKEAANACGLYADPKTDGSSVTFRAKTQLQKDITLVYFIVKGVAS